MKKLFTYILLSLTIFSSIGYALENLEAKITPNNSDVIVLLFHRFGEDKYPTTNIREEQLDTLIAYLKDNQYTVLPINQIIKAIQAGATLPPKTVAITIDDAYKSIYDIAYPKFTEAGFPFTIFVSTKQVNGNNPNYLSWDNISEMSNNGVDIQNHTVHHPHMVGMDLDTLYKEITDSQNDITENTGIKPTLFAYPYGEANTEIMSLVKDLGFNASFGQYSGVVNATSNMFYLPRFSINENYGTLKRLKLVLGTKSLPVSNLSPADPLITTNNNPPQIEFTADEEVGSIQNLNCYQSSVGKVSLEKSDRTVYLNFSQAFRKGRTRINCTLPHPKGGFRWYGMQYLVK